MPRARSSSVALEGARRAAREVDLPAAAPADRPTVGGSSRGLKTRSSTRPSTTCRLETSAPRTVSAGALVGLAPAATGGRHHLERGEHVVAERPGVLDVERRPRSAASTRRPDELEPLDGRERAGRHRPQRHAEAREHPGRAQQGDRELVAPPSSIPVTSYSCRPAVHHGQPARLDEPSGGERREPELVGPALGGEPAAHGAECALGDRPGRAPDGREVHAEAVVARRVDERRAHPHAGARRRAPGSARS